MRKVWMVVAVLVVGLSVVAAAEYLQLSIYSPPAEIDGSKPFCVEHGWGGFTTEILEEMGYKNVRDAVRELGLLFELYIDGIEIEPTAVHPIEVENIDPTTGEVSYGWSFHWFFRFQPGDLSPGLTYEFTGHWLYPGLIDSWRTAEIPVI